MSLSREDFTRLLRVLDATEQQEIDCSEFLGRVAGFIERFDPEAQPPRGYEDLVQHLRVCPECLEEFEALYQVLRDEHEKS